MIWTLLPDSQLRLLIQNLKKKMIASDIAWLLRFSLLLQLTSPRAKNGKLKEKRQTDRRIHTHDNLASKLAGSEGNGQNRQAGKWVGNWGLLKTYVRTISCLFNPRLMHLWCWDCCFEPNFLSCIVRLFLDCERHHLKMAWDTLSEGAKFLPDQRHASLESEKHSFLLIIRWIPDIGEFLAQITWRLCFWLFY